MEYKGIELEPITKVQAFEEPKEMLVWNTASKDPYVRMISAITKVKYGARERIWAITYISREMFDYVAEIPTPQKREMNSLEVMEYLHLLQMNLSTGIIRVDNHPKGIVYSTHGHGLIVYDPDVESSDKKYSSYSEFNEYDKLKDCKFGILKNGEVTEFELPEIEV